MRVVVADDAVLVRRGVAALLTDAHVEVVGEAGDVKGLLELVEATTPDVAVVDIRMPPTHTDEGVRAAAHLRRLYPDLGIVLLSQFVDVGLALRILDRDERGLGYLLKDRVTEADQLVDALVRVRAGGTVVDPSMVQGLVDRADRVTSVHEILSFRELRILALIAEGSTDRAIADTLLLSGKTVEAHITKIFRKLDLGGSPSTNRRVHAVLRYLRDRETGPEGATNPRDPAVGAPQPRSTGL